MITKLNVIVSKLTTNQITQDQVLKDQEYI